LARRALPDIHPVGADNRRHACDAAATPALKTQMAVHCDVAKGIIAAPADVLSA
jgi:hypothetical protein